MKRVMNKVNAGALALGVYVATKGTMALAAPPQQLGTGQGQTVNPINIFGSGDKNDLYDLIGKIINVILIAVGVIAVLYLIYGGITYVTAGGDAEKATQGRTTITNAIIGIIIIAASFAIYNFVVGSI